MAEHHQIPTASSRHEAAKVAVVVVPLPGHGHLNQCFHLSRIISNHDIAVHFVSTLTHIRQVKLRAYGSCGPLSTNSYLLHFHDFTIPFEVHSPEPNSPTEPPSQFSSLFNSVIHLRQPVYYLVSDLAKKNNRVVLIVDFFLYWVFRDYSSQYTNLKVLTHAETLRSYNISSIPNAETYCFHCVSPFSMHFVDRTALGKPVLAEGKPIKDLPYQDSVFTKKFWPLYRGQRDTIKCNHGNLYNSCRAIEGQFLDLVAEDKLTNADKHWAIGPFNAVFIHERKTTYKYFEWLDKKPPKSVIFVSFGTTTCLLDEQVNEIALGLERSGQNFMWVLRDADKADVFAGESRRIPLPEGFEERIEGRGIIIRDWEPQLEILGHPSVGGFLSHCGWNSCMESISMGVPIATWPMHPDQPLKAILVTQVLKIGVKLKNWTLLNEIVKAESVEKAVKTLMASEEGDEMRKRAKELSIAVKESVKEDGVTTAQIASFIAHITR